ncbi:MAG: hypothetical protein DME23_00865, partial [Verrucomicrobia bacterium]
MGQTYAVGFYIGRASLGSGTMSLRAEVTASGGQVLGSLDSAGPASPGYGPAQTFIFTATSTSSTLTFTDTSSATVAVDVVLDNVSVTPSSGCVTPPSGLVSWWPGNGSPNDLVSGNDGTLRSNAAYAAGEVGQAFSLDGVSDGVVIGNPVNLQLQNFTIEAWIKRASLTKSTFGPYHDAAIFAYSTGGYGLAITDEGHLSLTKVWNSNVGSTLTVTDTNWHHVAVTKSGGAVVFYVDGVADTPVTYDPGFTFTSQAAIGDNPDNPGVGFFGRIDELSIYNRALATSELQSIFNAGSAGKCAPPPVGPLVNGSFELPALAAGEGQVLSVGSTHMTGWTVGGTGGPVSFQNGTVGGVSPLDGHQHILFNAGDTSPGTTIFQTFSTAVGQVYTVSFTVGRVFPGSGTVSLHAEVAASGGAVLGSLNAVAPSSVGYGSAQTFTFTATSTSSTLTFTDTSSATVAVDVLLDNVSVVASSPAVGPFTNGSFESPALAAGEGQVLSVGSTHMTGWTVGGTGGPVSFQNGTVGGVSPLDGHQHILFN